MEQNPFAAQRLALPGWWAGRDNTALTEPAPSHANCLKTRRLPPPAPAFVAGVRVLTLLGGGDLNLDYHACGPI